MAESLSMNSLILWELWEYSKYLEVSDLQIFFHSRKLKNGVKMKLKIALIIFIRDGWVIEHELVKFVKTLRVLKVLTELTKLSEFDCWQALIAKSGWVKQVSWKQSQISVCGLTGYYLPTIIFYGLYHIHTS